MNVTWRVMAIAVSRHGLCDGLTPAENDQQIPHQPRQPPGQVLELKGSRRRSNAVTAGGPKTGGERLTHSTSSPW